jgi:hypothetical protein
LNRADRVTSCGVLIDDEDVSAPKAKAADCAVIAVDHPESAASEVIADGDFCVESTAEALAKQLDAALGGTRPPTSPAEHARKYDWDAIAEQAEMAYRRAIDGAW